MIGRALTPGQKRIVMDRILAAWLRVPALRLGQFLSITLDLPNGKLDLFCVEDDDLAGHAEDLADTMQKKGTS
jgi:hypothetical protein